jgi:hypothetical protein
MLSKIEPGIYLQKALPKEASKYPALFLKAWKKRATELAEDTEGDGMDRIILKTDCQE